MPNSASISAAIQDFDKAIALKPDSVEAFNNRGVSYAKLGQDPARFRIMTGQSP